MAPKALLLVTAPELQSIGIHLSNFALQGGQNYDFYVRAYCENNAGFGNWAGPVSYFAQNNINMCSLPINLKYTITDSSGSLRNVNFKWESNGEKEWEYILVSKGEEISEGLIKNIFWPDSSVTYTNLYNYIDYEFYVRAVCKSGERTEWVKKEVNL